jgi:chemotaxis protein CheX
VTAPVAQPLITELIDEAAVQGIADETWLALLGVTDGLVPLSAPLPDDALSAWVVVSGPWTGAVVLSCARATAEELSRTLLGEPETQPVASEDVADALGELANVVGGNVKALLPAPSVLGLPEVGPRPPQGSDADTCIVEALWRGQPVRISIQGVLRPTGPDIEEGQQG